MADTTIELNHKFQTELALVERDAKFTASLIDQNILNVDNKNETLSFFYSLSGYFKIAQAVYWGDINGTYLSAEFQDNDTISSYYDTQLTNPPTEVVINRNRAGKVLSQTTTVSTFDPRRRPWYQLAAQNDHPMWTDTYLYEVTNNLGITYVIPVFDANKSLRGVLGLDISLDWLSWYIDRLKVSEHAILFIVSEDGKLIAYPNIENGNKRIELSDIHTLNSQWVARAYDLHQKNKWNNFQFEYDGSTYLASFRLIPMKKKLGWLIGIVIPQEDFIGPLNSERTTNIFINLVIMLTGILLVSSLVNNIVNPVKRLIVETNKIKNFNFDNVIKVKSRVKEILLLSEAIDSMKNGLKAFRRYIPAELVKQLISSGEDVKIGGSKKNIVAFFTDIKDFTTITHITEPNELVLQLNEYFEALTFIIRNEQGTIDKYIGDAIMAFWGAPYEVANPCHHAATAALKFINHLNELNNKWAVEGKPAFNTRIGIHYGDAIVGNIGSTERINYTAIGDSINIASRLEGKNKELNTSILVSDAVYEQIKQDFIFEKVGKVTLKGLDEQICVYALLGYQAATDQKLSPDVKADLVT